MKERGDSEQMPSPEAVDAGCARAGLAASPSALTFDPSLSRRPRSGQVSGPRRPTAAAGSAASRPSRPGLGGHRGPGSGAGAARGPGGRTAARTAPPRGRSPHPGPPALPPPRPGPEPRSRARVPPHLPLVPGMRPNPAPRPKPRLPLHYHLPRGAAPAGVEGTPPLRPARGTWGGGWRGIHLVPPRRRRQLARPAVLLLARLLAPAAPR